MNTLKLKAFSVCMSAAFFFSLIYWYQLSSSILTQTDIDGYMSKIEAQTQKPGGQHDLQALRSFLDKDDGRPIYTVNLYNFHEQADYPAKSGFSGSGEQAYQRFSKVMISLMSKRGSHPIYGSNLVVETNSNWDRIVVVRYRSRRDLVDLFSTDSFANASLHKWASIREHERMIVQAIHIPDGKLPFFLLSLLIGIGVYKGGNLWMRRGNSGAHLG